MKNYKKELIWFVAIVLPITYAIGLYIWDKGGLGNPLSLATMYVPALTVLGLYYFKFKKPIFKGGNLGFNFKGLKYWIIAPVLLAGLSFLSYAIGYFFNPTMFDTYANIKEGLADKGFLWADSVVLGLLAIAVLNSIIGSLLNIPMFIGEELGWRAFMTPRLLKLYTPPVAFLIGAAIWALWHAVMIAEGLNYPSLHPILGLFLMTVFCFPLGIIIQYLYAKSKSVFVAALAHAALNKSTMTMSFVFAKDSYDTSLYGPTGVIGIILFSIVAIYLYSKIDWVKTNTIQ